MEYLLPDEKVMEKMAGEYAEMLKGARRKAESLGLAPPEAPDKADVPAAAEAETGVVKATPATAPRGLGGLLLVLYFAFVLGYNSGYGAAVSDAYRGVGGFQSGQGSAGNLDSFFQRRG